MLSALAPRLSGFEGIRLNVAMGTALKQPCAHLDT